MDWNPPGIWDRMREFLQMVPDLWPETPRAVLVISAHWEARTVTIAGGERPGLIFDYYGFPEHTYRLTHAAPGHPDVAAEVQAALTQAGIESVVDIEAGWDHGVFIPMKVIDPDARIPVVAMSLHASLDGDEHLRIGRALASLRDNGVAIIGSGFSYHGGQSSSPTAANVFDEWLRGAVSAAASDNGTLLTHWDHAPNARVSHPREEHLIPLMVTVGAGAGEQSVLIYDGSLMGRRLSGWAFGAAQR